MCDGAAGAAARQSQRRRSSAAFALFLPQPAPSLSTGSCDEAPGGRREAGFFLYLALIGGNADANGDDGAAGHGDGGDGRCAPSKQRIACASFNSIVYYTRSSRLFGPVTHLTQASSAGGLSRNSWPIPLSAISGTAIVSSTVCSNKILYTKQKP